MVSSHQAISCPIVAQTALSLSGSPTSPHFFNIQLCRCQERIISFLFFSVLIGTIKSKIDKIQNQRQWCRAKQPLSDDQLFPINTQQANKIVHGGRNQISEKVAVRFN